MRTITVKGREVGSLQIYQLLNQCISEMTENGYPADNIPTDELSRLIVENIDTDFFWGSEPPEEVDI